MDRKQELPRVLTLSMVASCGIALSSISVNLSLLVIARVSLRSETYLHYWERSGVPMKSAAVP